MVSTEAAAIADLFDRIPALAALRGVPQIEAEEAIRSAVANASELFVHDSLTPLNEVDLSTDAERG